MCKKSVLLALSGGVDSSVAARLLQEQGFEVTAAVFEFSPIHKKAVVAAKSAAAALGIPLHVIACHEEFYERVITPFALGYKAGETPNPCVVCNPLVKFFQLCLLADRLSCQFIATGHYAQTVAVGERFVLKKAAFLPRDQSYMLYRLTQSQLSRLILPLSALSKDEVRCKAEALALPCACAPDSQEICFVEDNDYPRFIDEHFGPSKSGRFISPEGEPCGEHRGISHYTVGQRRGLHIAMGRRVFIKHIDPVSGDIFLAESGGELVGKITLSDCVYMPFESLHSPLRVTAKIRSQATGAPALLSPLSQTEAEVVFDTPQKAPAKGQSCVLYDGDIVVGGGFIGCI